MLASAPEQARFEHSLAMLHQQGWLEYTGEYGAEITTFVPFVAWLKQEGLLAGRRIVTYAGMRPYYFFLDDDEFGIKPEPRRWLPEGRRYWPYNSTYTAVKSPWHAYPDYRKQFAASGRTFNRPLLFVQNKFNIEWDIGPINFMPLNSLSMLLNITANKFDVVYSRPRAGLRGYSMDHNTFCDYPDRALIQRYPHVLDFEESCEVSGDNYNQAKLEMLSKSHLFVAVQGGGAHIIACFGNSLFLLLHHHAGRDEEYPHAYQHGPYKYLSKHPAKLMVARNHEDFHAGVQVMGNTLLEGGRIILQNSDTVRRLSL